MVILKRSNVTNYSSAIQERCRLGSFLGRRQAWRGIQGFKFRVCPLHAMPSLQGTFSEIYSVINTENDTLAALKIERKSKAASD